jgi:hypothetical protein
MILAIVETAGKNPHAVTTTLWISLTVGVTVGAGVGVTELQPARARAPANAIAIIFFIYFPFLGGGVSNATWTVVFCVQARMIAMSAAEPIATQAAELG